MFDVLLLVTALVLIVAILVYWRRTKQEKEPPGLEYARASDIYNKMATNDNNIFKLMTDFTKPVELFGPDGLEDETVGSTEISVINRFAI